MARSENPTDLPDQPHQEFDGTHDVPKPPSAAATILKLFSNPWVGLIGTVASILGLATALILYIVTDRQRLLSFYVHPLRAPLVTVQTNSPIRVFYGSHEITSAVTAAQILIWNRGKDSVRREHILEPLRLHTKPPAAILEARIIKATRGVTGCTLDHSSFPSGIVGIDCKILEYGDGIALQIIYSGTPSITIDMDGVIEGQGLPRPEPLSLESKPRQSDILKDWASRARRYWGGLDSLLTFLETLRRHPAADVLGSIALLLLVGGGLVWAWRWIRHKEREQREAFASLSTLIGENAIPDYFTDLAERDRGLSSPYVLWVGTLLLACIILITIRSIVSALSYAPAPFDFY